MLVSYFNIKECIKLRQITLCLKFGFQFGSFTCILSGVDCVSCSPGQGQTSPSMEFKHLHVFKLDAGF